MVRGCMRSLSSPKTAGVVDLGEFNTLRLWSKWLDLSLTN